jgi:hypothetical protein
VGRVTLQTVLYEGTNHIFFIYNDVNFNNSRYDYGSSATIGLNNGAGQADRYSYNTASLNNISAVCFFYPNDYSDALASYGDVLHNIPVTQNVFLGSATDNPDSERGMSYSVGADGDNNTDRDDENGVTFRSPAGTNHSIYADVTINSTGGAVTVCGWLDIPSGGAVDGSFDTADGICQTTSGASVTFQWSNLPSDQLYTTYARFRVSTNSLTTSGAAGPAFDGEVEDYQITFDFQPTAVTIGKVEISATLITDFLSGIGVEQMDRTALLALLQAWDPAAAAALPADESREAILAALYTYLDPDGDTQVAILAWDTLEEHGTIGFYVDRRQGEDGWTRINNDMLPGLINAPMGGEYRLADPGVTRGSYLYQLIEQEARGTTRTYGPFSVELP